MGIFDDQFARERIAALEKELTAIKASLSNLQNAQGEIQTLKTDFQNQLLEASKRSPDYEIEARRSSEMAKELNLNAQQSVIEINELKEKLIEFETEISQSKAGLVTSLETLQEYIENAEQLKNDLSEKHSLVSEGVNSTNEKIERFEEIFQNHPDLEGEIENFEDIILKVRDSEAKASQLVKGINSRVIELETLYNQILGFIEKDENDEDRIVPGLKQELENAFNGLDSKRAYLESEYEKIEKGTIYSFGKFSEEFNAKSENQLKIWEAKYTNLNKKIEGLLPNALTAGLSYAFSEKKNDEIQSHENYKNQFQKAIIGLIVVSTIPFIISVYSIVKEIPMDIIINRIPKIVTAILPLYIPVLWFAISSSKKMNLSKRLIEEYTHKEVLSKTYEGLSRQIENLEGDETAFDLKTKLLQNFLLMYSENPGKLISDYNKTDHPIMELLENSNKLETTVQKLQNIPGLGKLSRFLESKSKSKLEQVSSKVEKGIDKALAINDNEIDLNQERESEVG